MRIRRLEIERYGHWHDVAVDLAPRGLTVLYGPNETGKSSLVRFIRGMLYGFRSQDGLSSGARPQLAGCGGELHLESDGSELALRRSLGSGGLVELRRPGSVIADPEPTLNALLGGVSRDVFERVFAIGLSELQELATLNGREVAEYVYDTSLGDDGEQVMAALRRAEANRQLLLDPAGGSAGLAYWQNAVREIDDRLEACAADESRCASLEREQSKLRARIAEQEWRRSGLRDQLRGHAFLEKVWVPWNRQRRLRLELAALPDVDGFPEDGSERLRGIEAGLREIRAQHERWQAHRQQVRDEWRQLQDEVAFGQHADEIRRLLREHEWLSAAEAELPAIRARGDAAQQQLEELRRDLGAGWTDGRLDAAQTDAGTAVALFTQAARYRTAARKRARAIRAYRKSSSELQRRNAELANSLSDFPGADLREAGEEVRRELDGLSELQRLRARQESLLEMLATVDAEAQAADARRDLPAHFYPALASLGIAGVGLVVAGAWRFIAGGSLHAALVGAIFVLLGVCCGGITWTIRQRFEPSETDGDRWQDRQRKLRADLDELEHRMELLADCQATDGPAVPDDELRIAGFDGVDDVSDGEQIAERIDVLTRRLSDLGAIQERERELAERSADQSRRRQRIRLLQRNASQARRDWCAALKKAGLEESVRVAASLETWRAVDLAKQAQRALRESEMDVERIESAIEQFSRRVQELARELGEAEEDVSTAQLLAHWRTSLESVVLASERREAAKLEWRRLRSEQKSIRRRRRELRESRRELLASVGAASRAEFQRLDAAWRRRSELESLVDEANEELREAAAAEPELAIVEDDLREYDGPGNRDAIETIETELSDLENDLRDDHQQLGRIEQELAGLREDRTLIELRFERAQAEAELERVAGELAGIKLAEQALEEWRAELESERQPATLRSAARYLQQLTAGRYQRVWAPLGEQTLVIDDDDRQSIRVDQLSSGTREQVFLAIRLALIDEFVRSGASLPIVLDDVFVNFDQRRTEAAVQTVIDYASDGRQLLLLTCHQHLVRLFEKAGATTVRLPESGNLFDRRRVG